MIEFASAGHNEQRVIIDGRCVGRVTYVARGLDYGWRPSSELSGKLTSLSEAIDRLIQIAASTSAGE